MAVESTINLNIAKRLRENDQFRKEYFRTRSRNDIATQLVALRKKRRMTQKRLAAVTQTHQSAISRLEKSEYACWNLQTLEGVAEALGARWRHILEPVEDIITEYENEELVAEKKWNIKRLSMANSTSVATSFLTLKHGFPNTVTAESALSAEVNSLANSPSQSEAMNEVVITIDGQTKGLLWTVSENK